MEEEGGKKRGEQRHTKVGQMQVASVGGWSKGRSVTKGGQCNMEEGMT